eukprot:jgi/Botrbrau1/10746/Bobra.180_2s0013.1
MAARRSVALQSADENNSEVQRRKLEIKKGLGKDNTKVIQRRALGDIINLVDAQKPRNIVEKENQPSKKDVEQGRNAAQLGKAGGVLTRKTAREAGIVVAQKALPARGGARQRKSLQAREFKTLQGTNEAGCGPSALTTTKGSLTSLLHEFSERASASEGNGVDDIDSADKDNPFAASDYVVDIFSYYSRIEPKTRANANYMASQSDINEKMRAILVDWLVEVHSKFKLMPETLHLAIDLIDRFLQKSPVTRKNLQLVGVTAMLIASKYEEIWAPELTDFIYISDKAYTRGQIIQMEKMMLNVLKFTLTVPTAYTFLGRLLKAVNVVDTRKMHFALYLVELSLVEYSLLGFKYSTIATASVYLMARIFDSEGVQDAFPPSLQRHSGLTEDSVLPCAASLLNVVRNAPSNNLQAIYKKYSNPKFCQVSKLPVPNIII